MGRGGRVRALLRVFVACPQPFRLVANYEALKYNGDPFQIPPQQTLEMRWKLSYEEEQKLKPLGKVG